MMVNLPCLMVSCTNFLRPTCSYTECLLSFRTGSCPTEWITAGYSSCLYFDLTDLLIPQGTVIPWTHPLLHFLPVIVLMQLSMQLHRYRVSYPEPCLVSELSGTRQGSGIIILMCLCSKCFLLFLPFYVRKHLFRIIRSSLLHNRMQCLRSSGQAFWYCLPYKACQRRTRAVCKISFQRWWLAMIC